MSAIVTESETRPSAEFSTARTTSGSGRVDQIDVLRGLSIIFVVIHHITLRIPLQKTAFAQYLPSWVVSDLRWNGYNGVVVFFVISGFLITSNCYRRWGSPSSIHLRQFYAMRFARIAPCLLVLLATLGILHLLHVPQYTIKVASLPRALVAALTFQSIGSKPVAGICLLIGTCSGPFATKKSSTCSSRWCAF